MKVAVIGSGIAGNTLVWKLKERHEVTVYESGGHLGGHTHTHSLTVDGVDLAVDSGFIVFNERTYPHFIAMLDQLGVEKQKTEMSFSVSCERTGLEYAGNNLNTLFAQRKNLLSPRFFRLIRDILRFNRESVGLLEKGDDTLTLGRYLEENGYGELFRTHYILPMGAAIWSQDIQTMLGFPARFFVRFFHNHGLLSVTNRPQWYVVRGGSRTYVEKIYAGFRGRVLLNTPALGVRRLPDGVEVGSRLGRERFDAVFLACHSDQALAMREEPSPAERDILGALPYRRNSALLHRGSRLLPRRRLAWSSWNARIPSAAGAPPVVCYHMNRLQSLPVATDLCVSLNALDSPVREEEVIAEMAYDHPLFTPAGVAAQARRPEISGPGGLFYCGAYWRNGFHEDGVASALDALSDFNTWENRDAPRSVRRPG